MTDKELKKLKKGELLELLLDQSREIDRLRAQVTDLEAQLSDRLLLMKSAGSLAEEALKLNRVFEAAQEAADQYLENIKHYAQQGEIHAEASSGTESTTGDEEVKGAAVE